MTTNETKTKHCNTCDTTQSVEAFSKHNRNRDGLQTQCKGCDKAYYKAHKEQIDEKQKVYQQVNKEQKRAHNKARREAMTQAERAALGSVDLARNRSKLSSDELYGGLTHTEACAMTLPFSELRLKLEAKTGLAHHIDHIVPVKAGGTHTKDNLQVITASDNLAKIAEDKLLVAAYTD